MVSDTPAVQGNKGNPHYLRILAFSDWRVQDHADLLETIDLDDGLDLIVYAGDDLDRFFDNGKDYFEEYARRAGCGKILIVAGNDDLPSDARQRRGHPAIHDLHGGPFFWKGYGIFGVEGCTPSEAVVSQSLTHTEAELRSTLSSHLALVQQASGSVIPIVVSHAPPHGTLDIARRYGPGHVGSQSLRDFLLAHRIPLSICGHCNNCGGRGERLGATMVVNVASDDEAGAEGKFSIITIKEGKVKAAFSTIEQRLSEHELCRLPEVRHRRLRHLLERGIRSLDDVVEGNRERLRVPGAGEWQINRWIESARRIRSGETGIAITEPARMRFLGTPGTVVWDIETDLENERTFLVGAMCCESGEFVQFFDPDDEAKCLREFGAWIKRQPSHSLISFAGSNFEKRVVEKGLNRNGLVDLKSILAADIDLGIELQRNCLLPSKGCTLEEVARAVGFRGFHRRRLSGFEIGSAFSKYRLDGKIPKWKALKQHNEEDVRALAHVVGVVRQAYETKIGGSRRAPN